MLASGRALEALDNTSSGHGGPSPYTGDLLTACGFSWDGADIARFLSMTSTNYDGCLIWEGARSRGRGNLDWYGSFHTQGRTVRAHKFYAVAVLGLRPKTDIHHLDHTCCNSLCVRHVECVPSVVNLRLRWIRVQVGLEPDPDYEEAVRSRMAQWLESKGRNFFLPEDAERLWQKYLLTGQVEGKPENHFIPDTFDPRFL